MRLTHRLVPITLLLATTAAAHPVVGGFDAARALNYSMTNGSGTAVLRTTIKGSFPGAQFVAAPQLTSSFVAGVDVLIVYSGRSCCDAIAPLSASEQGALTSFVLAGGTTVIVTDNDTFAGDASAVHASLLTPFGLATTGTLIGQAGATMTAPPGHAITDGPHGAVSSLTTGWPGWYTSLGSAVSLGTLNANGKSCLAAISRGALGPTSGAVLFIADANTTGTSNGATLIENTIQLASFPPYGNGCPGSGGYTPTLAVLGDSTAGGAVTLVIADGAGGAPSFVLVGLNPIDAAMGFECSLAVDPILLAIGPIPLSAGGPGAGGLQLPASIPASVPTLTLALQAFTQDPGGAGGFANSNGVELPIGP